MRRRLRVDPRYTPKFHESSAAYDVLGTTIVRAASAWPCWPDVSAYDAWTGELRDVAGRALRFRDVSKAVVSSAGGYDAFIEETSIIPTRSGSWHDFFNAGIWSRCPRGKSTLWRRQRAESRARHGAARTRVQDWLTHFDECGLLVHSDRKDILHAIRALSWRELFVERREELVRHARVWCFGHAVLEALREPFVGLMGKALLCHDASFDPGARPDELLQAADRWLAEQLAQSTLPPLYALPVLGLPGWHAPNERPSFYDQPRYFRTGAAGCRTPPTAGVSSSDSHPVRLQ